MGLSPTGQESPLGLAAALSEGDCTRLAGKDVGAVGARETVTWQVGWASWRKWWQLVFVRTCWGLILPWNGQGKKRQLPRHRCFVWMMNKPKPVEMMGLVAEGMQGFKIQLARCDWPGGTGRGGAEVLPLSIPALHSSEPVGNGAAAAGAAPSTREF